MVVLEHVSLGQEPAPPATPAAPQEKSYLRITVTADGKPLPDVGIGLAADKEPTKVYMGVTQANGAFQFEFPFPPGTEVVISLSKKGYEDLTVDATTLSGPGTGPTLELRKPTSFLFPVLLLGSGVLFAVGIGFLVSRR